MAKFYYRARDRKGLKTSGSIKADHEWQARKALSKNDLMVLSIKRFDLDLMVKDLNSVVEQFTQSVTLEEQLVLMNQLEMGISVGIPIIQMLELFQRDLENKYLKAVLAKITEDITQGSSLHEAFGNHPKVFDPIVIGLIKTGEVTGKLEETLARINQMIEQQSENRAKVKSAIFYPKIVVGVMGIVLVVIIYFVIPKLKQFLASFGADLPPLTKFVLGTSDFFISYWYLIFATFFGVRFAFKKWTGTLEGKTTFDRFKLKMPLFGRIFLDLELNNLCVMLALLVDSGIPLLDALETLKISQKNELFKNALSKCQLEISKGGSLTQGMEGIEIFPTTLKNLVTIGEESGRLQPVLKRLGRYYQVQINYQLDNLSKLIEPILLFAIFGMVLVIALAIMLPIWKMSSAIHH